MPKRQPVRRARARIVNAVRGVPWRLGRKPVKVDPDYP